MPDAPTAFSPLFGPRNPANLARKAESHRLRLRMIGIAADDVAAGRTPTGASIGRIVGLSEKTANRHIRTIKADAVAYPGGWPGGDIVRMPSRSTIEAGAKALAIKLRAQGDEVRREIAKEAGRLVARGKVPVLAAIAARLGMGVDKVEYHARIMRDDPGAYPDWAAAIAMGARLPAVMPTLADRDPTPGEIAAATAVIRAKKLDVLRKSGGGTPGPSPRLAKELAGAGIVARWKGRSLAAEATS